MRIPRLSLLVLAAVSAAFAQTDDGTLSITASRWVSQQPDQVMLNVYVSANATMSLDEILSTLQGVGITAADLSSVGSSQLYPGAVIDVSEPRQSQWNFLLPVQIGKLKDTVAALVAIQKSVAKPNSGIAVDFYIQSPQVSPELQATQSCPWPTLISEARTQAQKLASAAEVVLGPMVAINRPAANSVQMVSNPFPASAVLGLVSSVYLYSNSFPNPPPQTCAVTVQFKLAH